jgi:hypothetical protein
VSLWLSDRQPAANFLGVGREWDRQFGPVTELQEEELVFWIGCIDEFGHGHPGFLDFSYHTGAGIENNADGNGLVLTGKLDDGPLGTIVENTECRLFQPGYGTGVGVGDRDWHEYQVCIYPQYFRAKGTYDREPGGNTGFPHHSSNPPVAGIVPEAAVDISNGK